MPRVRESRHLWVGNLPDSVTERDVADHFQRYGRIESVKVILKRSADGGLGAFVDFVDIRCAIKAHESPNRLGDRELRTEYHEPSTSSLSRAHEEPGRRYERVSRGLGDDGYSGRPNDRYPGSYGYKEGPSRRDYDRGDSHKKSSSHLNDESLESYKKTVHHQTAHKRKNSESGRSVSPAGSGSASDSSGSGDSDSESESNSSISKTSHGVKKTTALQIRNLSARSSDTTIRGGLYHEFKKHGNVGQIKVCGRDDNRYAIVYFRRSEDVVKAMEACRGKMFLGLEMDISTYEGGEQEERVYHRYRRRSDAGGRGFNKDDDLYQFNATRTIFVGNIDRNTNSAELHRLFERYGEIVDIDIKKQATNNAYAFIQFVDITHAVDAKREMNRFLLGRNRLKIGFGKGIPTGSVWVGGLSTDMTEQILDRHFQRYGRVKGLVFDSSRGHCVVSFDHIQASTAAHNDLKERLLHGKRVRVDYASREILFYYDHLLRTGQNDERRFDESPPVRPRQRMYDDPTRQHNVRPGSKYHSYEHSYDRGSSFFERDDQQYDDYFRRGGAGYDSDDFGQELREYTRERARDPERRGEGLPRRRYREHVAMDVDGDRHWLGRDRGSPVVDIHSRREKRRDNKVPQSITEDKRPPVRIRYDSEEEAPERSAVNELKSVIAKRKTKVTDVNSDEEETLFQNQMPFVSDEDDALPQKESRSVEKVAKKLKHKEGRKKRRTRTPNENYSPDNEPSSSNLPAAEDVEKRTSEEKRTRKSDAVLKSVVVEQIPKLENSDKTRRNANNIRPPRSPPTTEEEHIIPRKRRHSPPLHRVERPDDTDYSRSVKGSRHSESDVKPNRSRPSADVTPPPPPPPPSHSKAKASKDSSYNANITSRDSFTPTPTVLSEPSVQSRSTTFRQHPTYSSAGSSFTRKEKSATSSPAHPSPTNSPAAVQTENNSIPNNDDNLMELLRRHPVMWQGLLGLKNDSAAIQMHYVSGNSKLADCSLPKPSGLTGANGIALPPVLRIAQRMRMDMAQLDAVTKRMQFDSEHCLLLALPCGRDPLDVHAQTRALKNGFIAYLQQKQAAGIINVAQPGSQQASLVLHVFPPCEFTHNHLSRVAPNLLDSATDSGHLMVVVATL